MPISDSHDAEMAAATVRHVDGPEAAVASTLTPSGRILDWVPIESQVSGGEIATPPPADEEEAPASSTRYAELEFAERGPDGTVPILRDLIEHRERVGRRGADKRSAGNVGVDPTVAGAHSAPPNPVGYYHATTAQAGTWYGAWSYINVYSPAVSLDTDHSLMQLGLANTDNPQQQTLEAGWTVDQSLNGDRTPHVFTYFTTNGYTSDGAGVGGYNQVANAWVQVDPNAYPGIGINGTSAIGGSQLDVFLKFRLWQGNWWFQCQHVWLGYYPASLFGAAALSDHASWAGFWGEVYSGLADTTQTVDQMGSGRFAAGGFGNACYQRLLRVRTGLDGPNADLNGSVSAENTAYYDVDQGMAGGADWGTYMYAGGSGRGVPPIAPTQSAAREHSTV